MRVVIVEDHALLREGLAACSSMPDTRSSRCSPTRVASDSVAGAVPDLVVLDVRMPPTYTDEGTRAARALKVQFPGLGVLVLSNTSKPPKLFRS